MLMASPRPPSTTLETVGLEVALDADAGIVKAIDGLQLAITRGETFALVGESGCGKSMTALALMRLLPENGRVVAGRVGLEGQDLLALPESGMRAIRGGRIGMIFQEPGTSLNPVMRVGTQIVEAIEAHTELRGAAARAKAIEWLGKVGIPEPEKRIDDYPFRLSGGQKQRVMIAMTLASEPDFLIADEPTTALDVTIQAQILNLLRELVAEENAALIMITHDLGVVAGMCERVNVMYAGMFMETGTARQLFAKPRHPYTLGLLQSIPRLDAARKSRLHPIEGAPRDMLRPPAACPFQPRCRFEVEASSQEVPPLEEIARGHKVACFNPVPVEEWKKMKEATLAG